MIDSGQHAKCVPSPSELAVDMASVSHGRELETENVPLYAKLEDAHVLRSRPHSTCSCSIPRLGISNCIGLLHQLKLLVRVAVLRANDQADTET